MHDLPPPPPNRRVTLPASTTPRQARRRPFRRYDEAIPDRAAGTPVRTPELENPAARPSRLPDQPARERAAPLAAPPGPAAHEAAEHPSRTD